ncbi:MAG: hypothetical protein DYG92_10290 [Leptolyngbya sp. PLA1]|nr:hypothetical protein [Leptolyngbya sp. PLA1]
MIVRDRESYLAAISGWKPDLRYPVLIDDGTPESRELIGLFSRGFQPARTVRWARPGPPPAQGWKPDRAEVEAAVAMSWGLPADQATCAALHAAWKSGGYEPPGLVLLHESDPAWTAGAALAAGRGQVLVFIQAAQGVDRVISQPEADQIARACEDAAEASGWSWRTLGDALDAITLCLNTPNRLDKPKGEFLAMTDRTGRLGEGAAAGPRWAYSGQVFGGPSRAAYVAMCSLFLHPRGAWLFDGYPTTSPWDQFDATKAGELLTRAGLATEVIDAPRAGARDWRLRAARPVDAGLILVNTKGNDDFFDLEPGQCKPGDVPLLSTPAFANIVHSWSASNAGNRDRLAGRWLERGAFCYAGSVHEPYLQAFIPTPVLAGRLLGGGAVGACIRSDDAPLWKITLLGDPLFTLGRPVARDTTTPLPLPDAVDADAGLREALTRSRFEEGLTTLLICGRDADAARLAEALLSQADAPIDAATARLCVLPLARAGRNDLVWRAYARCDRDSQRDPALRDVLWLTSLPLLEGSPDSALLDLLRSNLRHDMPGRDARTLAAGWRNRHGVGEALTMLEALRDETQNGEYRRQIQDVLGSPPDSWGP